MLPPLDHPTALVSSAAADAPFTLAGTRCTVRGSERRGVTAVLVDGGRDAAECRVENGACTRFCITPLGIERRLRVGAASIVEKTVVAPTDAALVIEWIADAGTELVLACRQSREVSFHFSPAAQRSRIPLVRDTPARVVITAGDRPVTDPALWVRVHAAAVQRRASEWLSVSLPARDLDVAFEWARFRVATGAGPMTQRLLALIALGELAMVRTALAAASDHHLTMLLGAYHAATGDDVFLRAQWPRAMAALAAAPDIPERAFHELTHAAEAVGGGASALADFRRQTQPRAADECFETDFATGNTRAAVRRWIDRTRLCFEQELGAWPATTACSAGDVITAFAHGLLGFEPDCARGRVRLRPQIPEEWPAAGIHNIRVGDAAVGLDYTRLPAGWRFSVAQTAGSFPLRLIFEPALPTRPAEALVDGQPAGLNYGRFGERIVAPVQLVLDAPRTIELRA